VESVLPGPPAAIPRIGAGQRAIAQQARFGSDIVIAERLTINKGRDNDNEGSMGGRRGPYRSPDESRRGDKRVQPDSASVSMSMVDVREMRVRVSHWSMRVQVDMGLFAGPRKAMHMPMMLIMDTRVRMCQMLVRMTVLMAFRHMQPYAARHQSAGYEQRWRDCFVLQPYRHRGAKKGSN
jgi:hypothetical protein